MNSFHLCSPFRPTGDQPEAINSLTEGIRQGAPAQTLLGVTGSGKTFTVANVIARLNRPTLILSHNKTLAAQLYSEMKAFFPRNAVEYFVSYYDYYQPEAYIPSTDTYIEKDLAVNEEIDRLRLHALSALLSGRQDVIVVASVSCLYGIGSPQDFSACCFTLTRGNNLPMDTLLKRLVSAQYIRNDTDLTRGKFRVRGDTVDIALAYSDEIVRVEFFGPEIDRITSWDAGVPPATDAWDAGVPARDKEELTSINIYPATIFTTSPERVSSAIEQIQTDLARQVLYFQQQGEELYAKRIEQRVKYDLEMIQEIGYCSGIENYSRYFDGRQPGTPPYCLLDYFIHAAQTGTTDGKMLVIVDESHVTVPQIHAMYGGDRARKDNLVQYGFRLPAARDNRPLRFEEWEQRLAHAYTIYMSATPGDYELAQSGGIVVEQLIRPTGLLDPPIDVRPTYNEVDDLMEEIHRCRETGDRVLVTTLTKRMAEELDAYLRGAGISCAYIHSDIDTIERVQILSDLRKGVYDVLVGVNLLREGLDLPEVRLVAVLDADKEGFLRDYRSLIQTAGRAARHVGGYVIMYGDRITGSMRRVIDESDRRRRIQQEYNRAHHITPSSVRKSSPSTDLLPPSAQVSSPSSAFSSPVHQSSRLRENNPHSVGQPSLVPSSDRLQGSVHHSVGQQSSVPSSDRLRGILRELGVDSVQQLDIRTLERAIELKRRSMLLSSRCEDYELASRLRDDMFTLEALYDSLS